MLRAGRINVPYGLRVVEHPFFVRQVTRTDIDKGQEHGVSLAELQRNFARYDLLDEQVQFLVGWSKSFPVTIGRPQLRIWTHGVESLVVIPLTVILGLAWGAAGAAVAVLVGACVFAAMWAVIAMRTEAVDTVPT